MAPLFEDVSKFKRKHLRSFSSSDIPTTCKDHRVCFCANSALFKETITLLSYNIFMRPEIPIATGQEYQDLRIKLFSDQILPQYDIVCLQEMFSMPLTSRRRAFIDEAKSLGFHWSHHTNRIYSLSPSIDGGLLVLSRLPIVKKDSITFTSAAFADWYATKGVLYCLIQTGPSEDHFLHLFCTHLQATYDERGKATSEKVRNDQLAQTVEFVNKCVDGNDQWPIAICGDLNVQCRRSVFDGRDSEEYKAMLQTLKEGLGAKGGELRDLVKEIDGETHPVTFGDVRVDNEGNIVPVEKSLNDVLDLQTNLLNCNQSLDKIFWLPSGGEGGCMEPVYTSINPVNVDEDEGGGMRDHPLTHLSDHYAVETKIRVKLTDNTINTTNSIHAISDT